MGGAVKEDLRGELEGRGGGVPAQRSRDEDGPGQREGGARRGDEEPADGTPKAIHYTEGGPWFDDYRDCEYADVWNQYHKEYNGYTNGKH